MVWVVDISRDIEEIFKSKNLLHEIVLGYPQIEDIHMVLVYNKRPPKKSDELNDELGDIFIYDDIKCKNNEWHDSPFSNMQKDRAIE